MKMWIGAAALLKVITRCRRALLRPLRSARSPGRTEAGGRRPEGLDGQGARCTDRRPWRPAARARAARRPSARCAAPPQRPRHRLPSQRRGAATSWGRSPARPGRLCFASATIKNVQIVPLGAARRGARPPAGRRPPHGTAPSRQLAPSTKHS